MRVDRFLEARFPGLSFSHIQRVVRKGELRVDGKRVDSKDRLEEGQSVRIPPLKLDAPKVVGELSEAAQKTLKALKEIDDLGGRRRSRPEQARRPCRAGRLGHDAPRRPDAGGDARCQGGQKPRLVHRIDRETSGCLLIAKTRFAASHPDWRVPLAVGAQGLLGAGAGPAEAEAGSHLDFPCEGGGERGRHHHAHRPAWRRGRQPRRDVLCGGRDRRQQADLGVAEAGDGPHPPAARPHGPYRSPHHRRSQSTSTSRTGSCLGASRTGCISWLAGSSSRTRAEARSMRPRRCRRICSSRGTCSVSMRPGLIRSRTHPKNSRVERGRRAHDISAMTRLSLGLSTVGDLPLLGQAGDAQYVSPGASRLAPPLPAPPPLPKIEVPKIPHLDAAAALHTTRSCFPRQLLS